MEEATENPITETELQLALSAYLQAGNPSCYPYRFVPRAIHEIRRLKAALAAKESP